MAAEEGGDFVTVAAELHGAPAAAMRAGIVVEKEVAGRIGAPANGSTQAFDKELGGGTGDGGEEPFETAFARDKLQEPRAVARDEFIVALGDA